ncbi:MAG: alkaline phosphatase family protein [Candidatus Velthaea sp.]
MHLWLTQSKILGRQEQVPHAARHNPFVYFHSLVDSGACAKNVVPLNDKTLAADLASIATRPNYAFITPNLCNDGHDVPCRMPGSPSTLADENAFLQEWVPIIVHSPAFQADGLLMITFDESGAALGSADGNTAIHDGSACCNEPGGANTQLPGLGRLPALEIAHGLLPPDEYASTVGHSGGGRTGTVLVSPFIKPGTVSAVAYNHYSTLRTIEDYFSLSHLGYAAYPGTTDFGPDVFGSTITAYSPKL